MTACQAQDRAVVLPGKGFRLDRLTITAAKQLNTTNEHIPTDATVSAISTPAATMEV